MPNRPCFRDDVAMRTLLAIALLVASHAPSAFGVDQEWVAKWSEDLAAAGKAIREVHPDPFTKITPEDLDRELDALRARLPELAHHEIEVELGRIVARIGDGHTRLTWPLADSGAFVQGHSRTDPPNLPSLVIHDYPIRFGVYDDGIFVEKVDERHARVLGARLVAIGGVTVDDAIERLTPVIRHDNRFQLLDLLPMHLVLAEILHARGLSRSPRSVVYKLETADGPRELALELSGTAVTWASAMRASSRPLSWKYLRPGEFPMRGAFTRNYWFEPVGDGRTVFLQFNGSENDGDETILEFSKRLRRHLDENAVDRVIVDLRYNWGGDNSLNRPLLHALIASDSIRGPGGLFVLAGRGTFSAAMMLAVDLEKHLAPVFVGEGTGSSPVHFGDSRRTKLPNTGLTLRISTLYWQYSDPRDRRDAIHPQLPAAQTWRDRIAGRDGELDLLLGDADSHDFRGEWSGLIGGSSGNSTIRCTLETNGSCTIGEASSAIEGLERNGSLVRFALRTTRSVRNLSGRRSGAVLAGHIVSETRPDYPLPFAMTPLPSSEP